jgi:hypothetical protein
MSNVARSGSCSSLLLFAASLQSAVLFLATVAFFLHAVGRASASLGTVCTFLACCRQWTSAWLSSDQICLRNASWCSASKRSSPYGGQHLHRLHWPILRWFDSYFLFLWVFTVFLPFQMSRGISQLFSDCETSEATCAQRVCCSLEHVHVLLALGSVAESTECDEWVQTDNTRVASSRCEDRTGLSA